MATTTLHTLRAVIGQGVTQVHGIDFRSSGDSSDQCISFRCFRISGSENR